MTDHAVEHHGLSLPTFIAWPLLAAGLGALLWGAFYLGAQSTPPRVVSAGPKIEDVRRIAKLAVLRVQVADVIEGTNMGGKAVVLVKGDADLSIDLAQVEITERDEARRTATLVLPAPQADRPRVDHDRTKIYEVRKTGLAAINPFADPRPELLEDCMRAAQESVEQSVRAAEFVTKAKEQTQQLLNAFYRGLDWTVTIRWK